MNVRDEIGRVEFPLRDFVHTNFSRECWIELWKNWITFTYRPKWMLVVHFEKENVR